MEKLLQKVEIRTLLFDKEGDHFKYKKFYSKISARLQLEHVHTDQSWKLQTSECKFYAKEAEKRNKLMS